jgi:hypothetical protein
MATSARERQLDPFLRRFSPPVAGLARRILTSMRNRLPGAVELVYDKANALVVGFSPTERPSDAVFSVVLYPRWLLLYFLSGASLPDPQRKLQGKGRIGRHIRIERAETFDDPAVQELIDDAIELSEAQFDPARASKLIVRMRAK